MLSSATEATPETGRRRRRRLCVRPRSITGLLLASFGLVALPLIVAVIFSVIYVNRLSQQSERFILQGVEVTRYSKRLNSALIAMERSALQYRILRSDALAQRFAKQAADFDHILKALGSLRLNTVPNWNLDALRRQTRSLSQRMLAQPAHVSGVIHTLEAMAQKTDLIADQGNLFVDQERSRLQDTTANARIFLLLCVFALIPGALILVAFFTRVIARPLHQILNAITRLGAADFSQQIQVVAPAAELDTLGARLDWMRRRLATLENEKQQFIRHMSHELKTPLASIREGTELLCDGTVGTLSPSQTEVAAILQRNSLELASLIENLLDFAAWQAHRAKLEYGRFDLRALLAAIVARQKLMIESKQLSVITPDTPSEMTADRDRIHLIIDNLLANAVKFSPRGATIRVDIDRQATAVNIRVTDAGPGVPEAERAAIFDAFFQSNTPQTADSGVRGTGIGLSVARECTQAHGGTIDVENAPGGGARFNVRIPAPPAVR